MALVKVQGALVSPAHTAAVFHAVNAVLGGGLLISAPHGASRSKATQIELGRLHRVNPRLYAYAAPWQTSNHVNDEDDATGALDIWNWAAYPELEDVMNDHGMIRDEKEHWHYNDTGAWVVPAGLNSTPLPTSKEDDDVKLWLYKSAHIQMYILIDHLNMTYREIPRDSLEHKAIQNDVDAGHRRWDLITDPAWGANFGSGQFRRIGAPRP